MRKDSSRKNRIDSDGKNKSERFERSNFKKREDDIKPEGSFSERPKKTFRDDKPRREPLSFEQKKKYADRKTKIEKNKRRFDFGQKFTNKDADKNKEGFERRTGGKTSFDNKRKPYARKEFFGERNKEDNVRKPFRDPSKTDRLSKNEFREEKKPYRKNKLPADSYKTEFEIKPIRLNKYIANSGICSRREADEMISAGVISVNGEIITKLGTKILPTDVVKYNNETMRKERPVYLLLNKPKDFITTVTDPENRNTVMSLIDGACKERVYPVGRLDRQTTGVLLFTNDGELTKKLTHPSSNIKKVYHVELDKNVKAVDIEKIAAGIELEDGFIKVDEIAYDNPNDGSHVGIELHSGKNRIVRRIFESLGYEVRKLDRVYFAGLTKKDLPRGRWRFLTNMELNNLKMQVGGKKVYSE